MPIADDFDYINKRLQEIQKPAKRLPAKMLSDEEFAEFMTSGALPVWAIEQAKDRLAAQEICDHAGWNFKDHGRCCFKCGIFMVDFGD